MYKEQNLFNGYTVRFPVVKKKKKNLFTDYEGFTEKFEPKKTTDDCFTPPPIFDLIIKHLEKKIDFSNKNILRPFYPSGDFESVDYTPEDLVIDNPPFSIISKICRFYIKKNIPFFLFAPHLTLFGSDLDCTSVVVGANIIYENGAVVKTSFLSNMFGEAKIIGDADLFNKIERYNKSQKAPLPKYDYPPNLVTVSQIAYLVEKGISIQIEKKSTSFCRSLDSQKSAGKGIFGSGFLISEKAAAEKAAAEKAAAEKAAAEKAAAEKVNKIIWELSDREKQIIAHLK